MNFLRLLPVMISFVLLAAHFMRAGQTIITAVILLILLLLFVKKYWVPWVMQIVLVFGAIEWIRTLLFVAQMRIEFDMPWTRMAIILGAVALFTLLSALVFRAKALKQRFNGLDQ